MPNKTTATAKPPAQSIDYKRLSKQLQKLLASIEVTEDTLAVLDEICSSIIAKFGRLGLIGGRTYEADSEGYVLRRQFGVVRREVEPGFTIPHSYPPLQRLLELGVLIASSSAEGSDPRIEDALGVDMFAAIAVGDDNRFVVAFDLAEDADRSSVRYSLSSIRLVINLKVRSEALAGLLLEARRIQLGLFPRRYPPFAGYDLHGRSMPAEVVGGDVFDFITLGERILGVAIADSSGHGLPAALQARDVIIGLRMGLSEDLKVSKTIEKLNRVIHTSRLATRFISLFYGELERNGNFIYCNAGHNPPLLLHKGRFRELTQGGLILGPNPDAEYERGFVSVEPGDVLLLYTDGVIETLNAAGREFGLERLRQLVLAHQEGSAYDLVQRLFEELESFQGGRRALDDRTAVAIKRRS
ncbi:MAG TPA: PP2C family protein-serine/threonine phosphatase [Acidobacteriota bacterium]